MFSRAEVFLANTSHKRSQQLTSYLKYQKKDSTEHKIANHGCPEDFAFFQKRDTSHEHRTRRNNSLATLAPDVAELITIIYS